MFEGCVDSVESALSAIAGGAGRLELCESLVEGGVTPSIGKIRAVGRAARAARVPVHVLIRPRAGDFFYSADEFEVMLEDVRACVEIASVSAEAIAAAPAAPKEEVPAAHAAGSGAPPRSSCYPPGAVGIAGVVIGVLTRDGLVDAPRTLALAAAAAPLAVTFHRAIDVAADPIASFQVRVSAGTDVYVMA